MAKSHKEAELSDTSKTLSTDVIIVGGGHAGCTMAALLADNGVDVVCIDRDDATASLAPGFDARTTTISYGSRNVLAAAGVWDALIDKICAIRDIKITEAGSPTLLHFLIQDAGEEAFGWVVENRFLRQSLYQRLAALPRATHLAPAVVNGIAQVDDFITATLQDGRIVQGKILIGADGRQSFVRGAAGIGTRGWSYRQRALVCIVEHENPHDYIAVEDFRPEGPFAILPMQNDPRGAHRSALVWTEHGSDRRSALHWDEHSFNAALAERFPKSYGRVRLNGTRAAYPLGLTHAQSYIGPRLALVADAAHGIHPIAGQGLNLGLRDIADLTERLVAAKQGGKDIGSDLLLNAYEAARRTDNMAMAGATDLLNRIFSNDLAPVRAGRKIGLTVIEKLPRVQRFFMRQAMGSAGLLPSLVKTGKFQNDDKL